MYLTEQLAAVPRLSNLGPLFKSSPTPVELTESETEYIVRCVKHTFPHHVVFQVPYRYIRTSYEDSLSSASFSDMILSPVFPRCVTCDALAFVEVAAVICATIRK